MVEPNTVGSSFTTVHFTTIHFYELVESDRALPTCGASLLQPKRPFSTQCTSSSFPMCMFHRFLFQYSSFKLNVIFPPMTSTRKTGFPLLQKGVKRTRRTVPLETKILVFRKMEAGEKRANDCSYPATVTFFLKSSEPRLGPSLAK